MLTSGWTGNTILTSSHVIAQKHARVQRSLESSHQLHGKCQPRVYSNTPYDLRHTWSLVSGTSSSIYLIHIGWLLHLLSPLPMRTILLTIHFCRSLSPAYFYTSWDRKCTLLRSCTFEADIIICNYFWYSKVANDTFTGTCVCLR